LAYNRLFLNFALSSSFVVFYKAFGIPLPICQV